MVSNVVNLRMISRIVPFLCLVVNVHAQIVFNPGSAVQNSTTFGVTVTGTGTGFAVGTTTCVQIQTPSPLSLTSVVVSDFTHLTGDLFVPKCTPPGVYDGIVYYSGCSDMMLPGLLSWNCVSCFTIVEDTSYAIGLNLSDKQICIDGDAKINLSFGQHLIDSCNYVLEVNSPTGGMTYSFLVGHNIRSADTILDLRTLLSDFSFPMVTGTYQFSLTTTCPATYCPADTIRDSLVVTDVADVDLHLEDSIICAGGNTGLVIQLNNAIDSGFTYSLSWKSAIDSGISMIDPIKANIMYTYSVDGLIPGTLSVGYYDFTLTIVGPNVCPTASRTVRLLVNNVSKFYVDSSATGANTGLSWKDAYTNLQDALTSTCDVDTICVAQGTYYPTPIVVPKCIDYPDCGDGKNNAIVHVCDGKISVEVLTSGILEYVKVFDVNTGYAVSYWLCDEYNSVKCTQNTSPFLNLPAGKYNIEMNYFPLGSGTDCFIGEFTIGDAPPAPDRSISFNIPDSIVLLGGFPAGGGTINQRDWDCNKTILCGDIDKDKTSANNSYHVVTTFNTSPGTVVDGFCISGGNANGTGDDRYGAGWFNQASGGIQSSPTIKNCIISGNQTGTVGNYHGGGMANYGNDGPTLPTLINCIISNNSAVDGAGVYNYGASFESSPKFHNCIISGNKASGFGGAMYNDAGNATGKSNPYLINTVIAGNQVPTIPNGQGGAMTSDDADITGHSIPVLVNCIIWNNTVGTDNTTPFRNLSASFTAVPNISYSMLQSASNSPYGTFTGSNNKIATDRCLSTPLQLPLHLRQQVISE